MSSKIVKVKREKFNMLQWITVCFQHFLNTFIQVDEKVIEKMHNIENSINNLHQDIEKRIDVTIEKVKDYEDYREVQNFYRKKDWIMNKSGMNGGSLSNSTWGKRLENF